MKRIALLLASLLLLASCGKEPSGAEFEYALRIAQGNVENEVVSAYMAQVSYTDRDYSYSLVKPYYESNDFSSPAKFAPRPVMVKWTPNAETYTYQTLTISDGDELVARYGLAGTVGSKGVFNLIPGRRYELVLAGKNGQTQQMDTLAALSFAPEGQVRMIHVPGVNNVRDLGGWKSEVYRHDDGTPMTIRYGRLYRGGELDRKITLSDEARKVLLKDLGIEADADFRNDTECASITSSALGDIDYQRIATSSYAGSATSSTHAKDFKWILERLREGKNVYFHCVAGADRTGTMGYLLEGVLGVSENDQCKDWELTCFYSWRSRVVGEKYDYGTMVKKYFDTFKGITTAENCVAYFKKYGITDAELDEFRSIMLE